MKIHRQIIPLLALLAFVGVSRAGIVTDNNLTSTSLGTLSTSGAPASVSFSTTPGTLNAVTATVQSTSEPFTAFAGPLSVISPNSDGSSYIANSGAYGTAFLSGSTGYGPVNQLITFSVPTATTSLNYVLGYNAFVGSGWNFQATSITQYSPTGADSGLVAGYGGNLIPNASFENTSVNLFQNNTGGTGGSIVANGGVQGSNVFQNNGTAAAFINIPLTIGVSYALDFWYKGGSLLQYGYSSIPDGFSLGAGNSYLGNAASWTEVQYDFTATSSSLYLGGMTTGDPLLLDSIYLGAAVPEPSTWAMMLGGVGMLSMLRRRRA